MSFRLSALLQAVATATVMLATTQPVLAQRGMLGGMGGQGLNERQIRIVVGGGLTVPSGEFKATHENGFHYGAMLIVPIPLLHIAFRPEVSLTSYRMKKTYSTQAVYGDFKNTKTISGLGNIEVPIAAGLYVMGGGGILNVKADTANVGAALSANKFMFDVGGGYRFRLGDRIDGYLEAKMGAASFDRAKFGYSRAQFVPLTFGFIF